MGEQGKDKTPVASLPAYYIRLGHPEQVCGPSPAGVKWQTMENAMKDAVRGYLVRVLAIVDPWPA